MIVFTKPMIFLAGVASTCFLVQAFAPGLPQKVEGSLFIVAALYPFILLFHLFITMKKVISKMKRRI